MQRRKWLKTSAKGLPVLWMFPSLLSACAKDPNPSRPNGKSVVVVGAGIAGLAAAKHLKEAGFSVQVLEAQGQIGGRIRTERSTGIAFDEGASWIHGPNGNPLTKLAYEAGATSMVTPDDEVLVFNEQGVPYQDNVLSAAEDAFSDALEAVQDAGTSIQSFQSVFQQLYPTQFNDPLWKYMLSAYLEFDTGADISDLSSVHFEDDEAYGGADVLIINGYDRLTDQLANGLEIKLNQVVTSLNYAEKKVQITANGALIEADFAVVTVPLGVLKKGTIAFTPELPTTKKEAILHTEMGNVNKFLLVWDQPFWDTSLQYIGFTPQTKGKFNYFLNLKKNTSANALMTFAIGDYANLTESKTEDELIQEIMQHLKQIYGNNLPNPTHFRRTKWGQQPYSYGAYSFATNGRSSADFDTLAAPLQNLVFFAGEHTHRDYRGTAHGAYASGIREAENIIDLV
jgi:monoamine oxidase